MHHPRTNPVDDRTGPSGWTTPFGPTGDPGAYFRANLAVPLIDSAYVAFPANRQR